LFAVCSPGARRLPPLPFGMLSELRIARPTVSDSLAPVTFGRGRVGSSSSPKGVSADCARRRAPVERAAASRAVSAASLALAAASRAVSAGPGTA
jgi:hypothetical protein